MKTSPIEEVFSESTHFSQNRHDQGVSKNHSYKIILIFSVKYG